MKLQTREHDKRSIPILNQYGTPEMLDWLLSKAGTVPDQVAVQWLVGAMRRSPSGWSRGRTGRSRLRSTSSLNCA
ncbi:hypothetical protein B0T11DRAFT_289253 [Plectosphaerella cucumerina]|uniref:Uncharacterized protein n=1 Tax=Plectosphaerella cucumerina TaxID=40658 RepID=A0A8K0T6T1_9PEZI|nr:hypothetical protein B0T11DRAFT_289253 [Plectosphaerella cucumerina]